MSTASDLELQAIGFFLRRRERLFRFKIAAMLTFGIPLSFLGAFTIATILWFASILARGGWEIHWSWLFWALAVVTVPLLYHLERRTGGDYYDSVMSQTDVHVPRGKGPLVPGIGSQIVALPVLCINARPLAANFVELFLFGPRLVLGAIRQIRIDRSLRGADFMRAVEIVRLLACVDGGVDTAVVLRGTETLDQLLPTLAYLVFHKWIGIRGRWDRIWLISTARQALPARLST